MRKHASSDNEGSFISSVRQAASPKIEAIKMYQLCWAYRAVPIRDRERLKHRIVWSSPFQPQHRDLESMVQDDRNGQLGIPTYFYMRRERPGRHHPKVAPGELCSYSYLLLGIPCSLAFNAPSCRSYMSSLQLSLTRGRDGRSPSQLRSPIMSCRLVQLAHSFQ